MEQATIQPNIDTAKSLEVGTQLFIKTQDKYVVLHQEFDGLDETLLCLDEKTGKEERYSFREISFSQPEDSNKNAPKKAQEQIGINKGEEINNETSFESNLANNSIFVNICINSNVDEIEDQGVKLDENGHVLFNCSFNYSVKNKPPAEENKGLSLFTNKADISLQALKEHVEKGRAFSPFPYIENKRTKNKALPSRLLVLDVDDNWTPESFMDIEYAPGAKFEPEIAYTYPSPSDSPEHRKFRVVFILQQELEAGDLSDLMDILSDKFGADTNSIDAARLFYGNEKAKNPENPDEFVFRPDCVVSKQFMDYLQNELRELSAIREEEAQKKAKLKQEKEIKRQLAQEKNAIFEAIFGKEEGWTWKSFYSEVLMPEFESLSLVEKIYLHEFGYEFKSAGNGVYQGKSPFSPTNRSGTTLKLTEEKGTNGVWYCHHLNDGGGPLDFLALHWIKHKLPVEGDEWKEFTERLAAELRIAVPEGLDRKDKYHYFKENLLANWHYLKDDPETAGDHLSQLIQWTLLDYPNKNFNQEILGDLAKKALRWYFHGNETALETALKRFNEGLAQKREIKPSEAEEVDIIQSYKKIQPKGKEEFDLIGAKETLKALLKNGSSDRHIINTIDMLTVNHTWQRNPLLKFYENCLQELEEEEKAEKIFEEGKRFAKFANWDEKTKPEKIFHPDLAAALRNECEINGLDLEFLIQPLLVFAATCIGGKVAVRYEETDWTVNIKRWVASVARPSAGKSAGDRLIKQHLMPIQNKGQALYVELDKHHKNLTKQWKLMDKDERRANLQTGSDPDMITDALEFLKQTKLLIDGFTMEALVQVGQTRSSLIPVPEIAQIPDSIDKNPNFSQDIENYIRMIKNAGLAVAPDELSAAFEGMGQYKKGANSDLTRFMTLRNEDYLDDGRIGNPRTATDMQMSVHGGIQPDKFPLFFKIKDGSGFMRRWSFRSGMEPKKVNKKRSAYKGHQELKEIVPELFKILLDPELARNGYCKNMRLTEEAEALFNEYQLEMEGLGIKETHTSGASAIGRIEEYFGSMNQLILECAGLLHAIEWAMRKHTRDTQINLGEIGVETLEKAYYLAGVDARNFINLMLANSDQMEMGKEEDVNRIAAYLLGHLCPEHPKAKKISEKQKKVDLETGKPYVTASMVRDGAEIPGAGTSTKAYKPLIKKACEMYSNLIMLDERERVVRV